MERKAEDGFVSSQNASTAHRCAVKPAISPCSPGGCSAQLDRICSDLVCGVEAITFRFPPAAGFPLFVNELGVSQHKEPKKPRNHAFSLQTGGCGVGEGGRGWDFEPQPLVPDKNVLAIAFVFPPGYGAPSFFFFLGLARPFCCVVLGFWLGRSVSQSVGRPCRSVRRLGLVVPFCFVALWPTKGSQTSVTQIAEHLLRLQLVEKLEIGRYAFGGFEVAAPKGARDHSQLGLSSPREDAAAGGPTSASGRGDAFVSRRTPPELKEGFGSQRCLCWLRL